MRRQRTFVASAAVAATGLVLLSLRATHGQTPAHPVPANTTPGYQSEVKLEIRDGYRYIDSNGIPDHATGRFPNPGNPSRIAPQQYHFRVTMTPKIAARETPARLFGIALNGVPFDPGTAEFWNGDPRWNYEALSGILGARGGMGVDENLAHVQPSGAYHYHGLPLGLLKRLDYQHKMALVGYAADGFPIYGPYAYTKPNDPNSPLKQLKSSYRVKHGARPGGTAGPGGDCDGSFASDYEFVPGLGDLDTCNGRQGVTPEYPRGTYYYVLTANWPFVPRQFKGTPDASFTRRGPGGGPGGPGGPGDFGGPGGRGPGGPQGPGFAGGGGFGGPGGPPPGMVPAEPLTEWLGLTAAQQARLQQIVRVVDALRDENFALPALTQLKLTNTQIERIAAGSPVRDVLSATQRQVLDDNQRRGPGGPGGPGGFGGPGGPPDFGGPPGPER